MGLRMGIPCCLLYHSTAFIVERFSTTYPTNNTGGYTMKRIAFLSVAVVAIISLNSMAFAQDTTLTITGSGNVGIGTTSPSAKLEVAGGNLEIDLGRHMGAATQDTFTYDGDPMGWYSIGWKPDSWFGFGNTMWMAGYGGIKFFTGNAQPAVAIGFNGNVGIGTTAPTYKLEVNGNLRAANANGDFTFDGYAPFLNTTLLGTFSGSNGKGAQVRFEGAPAGGVDIGQDSIGNFVVETSDNARLVVQPSGNVGIGTTTPEFKLQVAGEIKVQNGVIRFGDQTSHRWTVGPQIADDGYVIYANGAAGYVLVLNRTTGRVGIGTTTPDQLLSVNGNASKVGGGSWATFSDRRVKRDINAFTDGLSVVNAIRPVTFRYNGKLGYPTDKTYVGVIAQEIQSVAPYTVDTYRAKLDPDDVEETDILRFDGSALTYIAINAIKELDRKVEEMRELQKENKNLSERLSELEALVKSLAAKGKSSDGRLIGESR